MAKALGLFDVPADDRERLGKQLAGVKAVLERYEGQWVTLGFIRERVPGSEASISARLRDLRKSKYGGLTIERRRSAQHSGLYQYRLVRSGYGND